MISVDEAKQIIQTTVQPLLPVELTLQQAAGLVLATDIFSPINFPPFHQSSVDGWAFRFNDLQRSLTFDIAGEVAAGSSLSFPDLQQKAVRIFTGAPVPTGADTVVMQEKATATTGRLTISDPDIEQGANVRPAGTDCKMGQLALQAGTVLQPAAIGYLAGLGITSVWVVPAPIITIIVTGNELQAPGSPLQPGKVFESNSFMLVAALNSLHINKVSVVQVGDSLAAITTAIQQALSQSNMVLLTGGVSVGDHDWVVAAAQGAEVAKGFHRVKQRPGKPLFFGFQNDKVVFGLPGNPSSVLTCFWEYVVLAIEQLTGKKNLVKAEWCTLSSDFEKNTALTHFVKAHCQNGVVTPLQAQESYRLSSYAVSNCLLVVQEDCERLSAGSQVEVHWLPA